MGMNKKFRVSFDVTVGVSHEQEAAFTEALVSTAKDFKSTPKEVHHILKAALEHGPESALEALVKTSFRNCIKDSTKDYTKDTNDFASFKISPAKVEVKR